MSSRKAPERFTNRSHRLVSLFCYLLIFVVAFRRVNELEEAHITTLALALIALFTVLFASESLLSGRYPGYPQLYFAVQFLLVQTLGIFKVYIDAWVILYIVLGFQVVLRCSRREALLWGGCSSFPSWSPSSSNSV